VAEYDFYWTQSKRPAIEYRIDKRRALKILVEGPPIRGNEGLTARCELSGRPHLAIKR